MKTQLTSVLIALAFFSNASTSSAQESTAAAAHKRADQLPSNWPRFRGPGGTGVAPALEVSNNFSLEDALWRIELPGKGHSSPVVQAERVYITCEAQSGKRLLMCLALEDGSEEWVHVDEFKSHRQHDLNSFAASTPALDEKGVYLVWTAGESLVGLGLDHEGAVLWQRKLGPYRTQHGSGGSPIVHEGVLLVAGDHEIEGETSYLLGLDAATGKELWRRERKSSRASYATPFVRTTESGQAQVLFASTSHGITCLEPASGKLLWEVDGLFEMRCVGSPVIAGDILFCSAGSGGGGKESASLRLPQDGSAPESASAWTMERAIPYVPTPVALGGRLYLWSDGGIVSCLRSADGEVLWRERVEGRFFGSPICIGERLFAQSMGGELIILRAADEFELLGRIDLAEPSQATPAAARGKLLLRTERHLMAIGQ